MLKPKTTKVQKQKSRAKNRRTKKSQEKAEAFQDMLQEKVKEAEKRHKTVLKYREDELQDTDKGTEQRME